MFKLEFSTANAAFEDGGELARILRELADEVEGLNYAQGDGYHGSVVDINGNVVGRWELS